MLKKWLLAVPLVFALGCSGERAEEGNGTIGAEGEPVVDPAFATAATRQNDTGIVFSGNHPRTINETCEAGVISTGDEWLMGETFETLSFSGQDCETGRDATAGDPSDGHAGFAFRKIAADGTELPADAAEWRCVMDTVTGLMWEAKSAGDGQKGNSDLHDADDVFSWYNTDSAANGGNIGDWNRDGADECFGYQSSNPASFCNIQAFAERVNQAALCSFSDWRVPTLREMTGIVNFGRNQPAIDVRYFPNTVAWAYWTVDPAAEFPEHARLLNFRFGMTGVGMRIDHNHVMLVRNHSVR
jgi:hypothetical protein